MPQMTAAVQTTTVIHGRDASGEVLSSSAVARFEQRDKAGGNVAAEPHGLHADHRGVARLPTQSRLAADRYLDARPMSRSRRVIRGYMWVWW